MPDRKLARTIRIRLKDGEIFAIRTIADAGAAIERLFDPSLQWQPIETAVQLMIEASRTGKRADIEAATSQIQHMFSAHAVAEPEKPQRRARKPRL